MAATKYSQTIKNDSKEYLTTALFQLLQTTDLNEIKISALVKRAGVSRMAFYRNFDTVVDVLNAYFEPKITQLFDDVIDHTPSNAKIIRLDAFLNHYQDALKLSIKRHYEFVIRDIFFTNMSRFYAQDPHLKSLSETDRQYWIGFMSAGVYNIWRQWILGDHQDSLDDLHELVGKLQTATFEALN